MWHNLNMTNKVVEFIESHNAGDLVYALGSRGREYFGLTNEESLELHGFVFRAIDTAKNNEAFDAWVKA